jgi:sphingolipid delta-4 desaturase
MGQQVSTTSFTRVGSDEPHHSRRKAILAKYPEILDLYGPDLRLLPMILAIVFTQLSLAVYATQLGGWQWFLLCWSLGGTLTHWLSLGNHELSHNLCFKTTLYNELLGIVANCAQGFPSCVTFKKYHLEHHYYQGSDDIDVDIPTDWEGKFFNNTIKKVLWVILQPAFYSLRPLLVNPKPMDLKEALNFGVVFLFDAFFAYIFGIKALAFNVAGTLLGKYRQGRSEVTLLSQNNVTSRFAVLIRFVSFDPLYQAWGSIQSPATLSRNTILSRKDRRHTLIMDG